MQQLSKRQGVGPIALEFIILTAARTGEVLGARWSEIDLEKKIWIIPAERMKAAPRAPGAVDGADDRVAEGTAARRGGLVFIGSRANAPLGKMVMPDLIKAMGYETTIHGMRASFRTWAAESTAFARELIEVALAHAVGDATEQAYQRGDLLEKRRAVDGEWGAFVSTPPSRAKRRQRHAAAQGRVIPACKSAQFVAQLAARCPAWAIAELATLYLKSLVRHAG